MPFPVVSGDSMNKIPSAIPMGCVLLSILSEKKSIGNNKSITAALAQTAFGKCERSYYNYGMCCDGRGGNSTSHTKITERDRKYERNIQWKFNRKSRENEEKH